MKADATIRRLRERLKDIAPYPPGCVRFEGRPIMNGTAFFPGGDGLCKPHPGDDPEFPFGGVLALGSDFGDVVWFDGQFEPDGDYLQELDGATWRGLLTLLGLADIPRARVFYSNSWPCLRDGDKPVGGSPPGARDREFTLRCLEFFRFTIELMRPCMVLPLGLLPTAFVAMFAPANLAPWIDAPSWRRLDEMLIGHVGETAYVPLVHPSMPNRRHRVPNTIEKEADLLRSASERLERPNSNET